MSLNVKVKVSRDKKRKTAESSQLTMHCKACAVRCIPRAAGDGTIALQPGVTGVHAVGGLRAVCILIKHLSL